MMLEKKVKSAIFYSFIIAFSVASLDFIAAALAQ
jgi:hypothetical protein